MSYFHKLFIGFLFLISNRFFGQDTLFLKNNTQQLVKILELNEEEIKYKRFNYLDGPTFTIRKDEAFLIVYENGNREIFKSIPTTSQFNKQESARKKASLKLGDYVRFSSQLGAVINNSFCNRRYNDLDKNGYKFGGETYNSDNSYTNLSINVGCNFLLGSNPYIKHVIGINYLRSKGEYNYTEYSSVPFGGYFPSSYHKIMNYKTKVDFLNLVSGIRFRISSHLHIEPLISINIPVNVSSTLNGSETSETVTIVPNPTTGKDSAITTTTIRNYNNEKSKELPGNILTISICPKLSYEFKMKEQIFGVYFSYNLAYGIKLPWWMFGVTYYPFKKLR